MLRSMLASLLAAALFLGAVGSVPGAHRCAIAAARAAEAAADGHGCCPESKAQAAAEVRDSTDSLCAGDCCGSDGEQLVAEGPTWPELVGLPLAAPESPAPAWPQRRQVVADVAWPRGPPGPPPAAPPWLRHRALLL